MPSPSLRCPSVETLESRSCPSLFVLLRVWWLERTIQVVSKFDTIRHQDPGVVHWEDRSERAGDLGRRGERDGSDRSEAPGGWSERPEDPGLGKPYDPVVEGLEHHGDNGVTESPPTPPDEYPSGDEGQGRTEDKVSDRASGEQSDPPALPRPAPAPGMGRAPVAADRPAAGGHGPSGNGEASPAPPSREAPVVPRDTEAAEGLAVPVVVADPLIPAPPAKAGEPHPANTPSATFLSVGLGIAAGPGRIGTPGGISVPPPEPGESDAEPPQVRSENPAPAEVPAAPDVAFVEAPLISAVPPSGLDLSRLEERLQDFLAGLDAPVRQVEHWLGSSSWNWWHVGWGAALGAAGVAGYAAARGRTWSSDHERRLGWLSVGDPRLARPGEP